MLFSHLGFRVKTTNGTEYGGEPSSGANNCGQRSLSPTISLASLIPHTNMILTATLDVYCESPVSNSSILLNNPPFDSQTLSLLGQSSVNFTTTKLKNDDHCGQGVAFLSYSAKTFILRSQRTVQNVHIATAAVQH